MHRDPRWLLHFSPPEKLKNVNISHAGCFLLTDPPEIGLEGNPRVGGYRIAEVNDLT